MKPDKFKSFEKQFNTSISQISEENYMKDKKFSLDDIPAKDNPSKVLNFKEFYENSKLEVKSNKNLKSNSQLHQQRSKSTFERESRPLQNKLASLIKPNLISYNINEYLPSSSKHSVNRSIISNSFIGFNNQSTYHLPQQSTAKNVFKDNLQYLNLSQMHHSPNHPQNMINVQQIPQCTCGAQSQHRHSSSQMLQQTQRSSCSCQYSQSSACHSKYASPLSNYSKNNHNHTSSRGNLIHHNSQPFLNLQSNKQQQAFNMNHHCKPGNSVYTSNENTPFKHQTNQVKSPNLNTNNGQSNLFQDRSISFLRTSDKKKTNGGYNTDDLIRDSENEVDLNQVSTIMQEAQMNFQEGFNNFLNQPQLQQINNDRAKREELAMQILQNKANSHQQSTNNDLSQSQVKTIKQSQNKPNTPILTLDSLQMSNINQPSQIQTPISNFDTNNSHTVIDFNNQKSYKTQNSHQQQQQQQQTHIQMLQQHYQSPCFNSFEDSSLNLFQLQTQSTQQNQQQPQQMFQNLNSNSEQSIKQNYNSVPQIHSSSQPLLVKSTKEKQKKKKCISRKLNKKNYNEEQYSNRKNINETRSSSDPSQHSDEYQSGKENDNNSGESSFKQTQSKSSKGYSLNEKDISMNKMLKEMSIQTQNDANSSFMEKSEIQVQTVKQKSDASCQYEPPVITNHQNKKSQLLPPQQKRVQSMMRIQQPSFNHPAKSVVCSIPSSKNSTINHNNNHFSSQNPSQELDDYYLQIDDDSIQHHQSMAGANSCGTTSSKRQINVNILQPGNHFSQPSIVSPYGPNNHNFANYDHFKSQCSEVIIRGSSETDISTRIAKFKNMKNPSEIPSQRFFQSQGTQNHQHSHQISGCQSIVNIGQHSRSQFTSIESKNPSPPKVQNKENEGQIMNVHRLRDDIMVESSYEANERDNDNQRNQLQAGDTFMRQQIMMQTQSEDEEEEEVYDEQQQEYYQSQGYSNEDQYQSIQTEKVSNNENNYAQNQENCGQIFGNQQQTDEEFNYTIRLNEHQNLSTSQTKKSTPGPFSQRPPIYHSPNQPQQNNNMVSSYPQQQTSFSNPYLGNTGSTAGFPQIQGYQFSQQTGRKSSINSSFHSQLIKNSNSQTSLQTSQRSQYQPKVKKGFLEQVVMIQRQVRRYLKRRQDQQHQDISEISSSQNCQGFFGDSTIQKPVEESLSNISAQLLNSLKQSLGSNLRKIKPNDQSYQKNILESLNLTTGNTFVKDTRHFHQGLLKERTQNLGNSSNLVLYSGSTNDNRNPFHGNSHVRNSDQLFLGNGQESQQSYGKQPLYEYEQNNRDFGGQQMSSPNNSGLLNLTEESNSGIFKLTPLASQNVTQKTNNIQAYNQTSHINGGTTESNNLNYSCSEMDSEWCNNLQKDGTVSPISINTTSSKVKNLNGKRNGQKIANQVLNNIMFQRSGSIQSEQIQPLNNSGSQQCKYTQKINIEDHVQSPLSLNHIASTKSAAHLISKQEKMLRILKSEDYQSQEQAHHQSLQLDYSDQMSSEQEWKLLTPMRQNDLNNLLAAILTQNDNLVMNQA